MASACSFALHQLHQPHSFKAVNLDDEDDDEEVETKAEPETGSEPLQSEAQGLEWTHTQCLDFRFSTDFKPFWQAQSQAQGNTLDEGPSS
jgi:hypothetical protein